MNDSTRFTDNGNGTITDTENELIWTREDSWQADQKWVTWDEAWQFAQDLSNRKFAGFNDWRMPEQDEVLTLYAPDFVNQDKYGKEIKLAPIFPPGPQATVWTSEGVGNDGNIVQFATGETSVLYKSKSGRMAVRPVRGKPFSERHTS